MRKAKSSRAAGLKEKKETVRRLGNVEKKKKEDINGSHGREKRIGKKTTRNEIIFYLYRK